MRGEGAPRLPVFETADEVRGSARGGAGVDAVGEEETGSARRVGSVVGLCAASRLSLTLLMRGPLAGPAAARPRRPPPARRRAAAAACRAAASRSLFVLGLGYAGVAIAEMAAESGWAVAGSARREGVARLWSGGAVAVHLLDARGALDAAGAAALVGADHVIVTVPPGGGGEGDPGLATLRAAVASAAAVPRPPRSIAYLSSTSVYGQDASNDAWIEETTPPAPTTAAGAARLAAEAGWAAAAAALPAPLALVRAGAIYGPGRCALDAVRRGDVGRRPARGRGGPRAHVADVAAIALAAATSTQPGPIAVYHAVDACPAPRGDVLAEAARLLGVTALLRAATDSSASSCRRISSSSTLVRLGLTLRHASYREGLAALASDDVAPFGRWGGAPEL